MDHHRRGRSRRRDRRSRRGGPQDAAKEKTETTQPEQKEELTLEGETSGSYDEYGMTYTISGMIKNNTDQTPSYVQVTFNLYDEEGNQIGTAMDNINDLEAGGTWKFEAVSWEEGVASYRLAEISGF
ncbi:MAG: FxLYD domain-containing protein [Merdibacter sp.]